MVWAQRTIKGRYQPKLKRQSMKIRLSKHTLVRASRPNAISCHPKRAGQALCFPSCRFSNARRTALSVRASMSQQSA
eukprot:3904309-Prymnesium_polylepis.1